MGPLNLLGTYFTIWYQFRTSIELLAIIVHESIYTLMFDLYNFNQKFLQVLSFNTLKYAW